MVNFNGGLVPNILSKIPNGSKLRFETKLNQIPDKGEQGSQGSIGNQGNQGFQGRTGGVGFQGLPSGFQGIQGSQGFQGPPLGFQGSQGRQGTQGTQGNQGLQGVIGTQGRQGSTFTSSRITTPGNLTGTPLMVTFAPPNSAVTAPCSSFTTQTPCELYGCTWDTLDCGDFDEIECGNHTECSWNNPSCDGGEFDICLGGTVITNATPVTLNIPNPGTHWIWNKHPIPQNVFINIGTTITLAHEEGKLFHHDGSAWSVI